MSIRKAHYKKMPKKLKGFVFYVSGTYHFVINSRLPRKERAAALGYLLDKQEDTACTLYLLGDL